MLKLLDAKSILGCSYPLFPHWRLLLPLSLVVGLVPNALQADAYLAAIGGDGGSQYKLLCAENQNLAGFELRTADDVDGLRPICVIGLGLKPNETAA